jgi:SAM-dependent methyltransferase
MPFYDFWRTKRTTALGKYWVRQAATFTLQRMLEVAGPIREVVEIGPGHGTFMRACQARGLLYTAVDANLGFLKQLEEGRVIHTFVPPLPLHDEICDAAVATHVIEHAAGFPQAQALLAEMVRIVRPGGYIVITAPDLLWYGNYFWDCDYSHNFPTSARRLQQMFFDQSLEIARLEYVYNHMTGWKGYLVGRGASLIPYHIFAARPGSRFYNDQIYKSRLSFARGVFIIGRKPISTAATDER